MFVRKPESRPTFWRCGGKFASEAEFNLEVTTGVWCTLYKFEGERTRGRRQGLVDLGGREPPTRSLNDPGNIKHVILVRHDANSLGWIRPKLVELLHKPTEYSWRDGLFPSE